MIVLNMLSSTLSFLRVSGTHQMDVILKYNDFKQHRERYQSWENCVHETYYVPRESLRQDPTWSSIFEHSLRSTFK
nr:hypothetical protein [Tanacetum cinerariifolium]